MNLRPITAGDAEACVDIVRRLPDHFTPDTYDQVRDAVARQQGWLATGDATDLANSGAAIGFVLADRRYARSAELTWLGVIPEQQRRGVGTALVERLLGELRAAGVAVVEVKTLDESAAYEPYVATRAFYEGLGFVQVDAIDPYPGWQPGNPCAIYVASLVASTREPPPE